MKSTTQDTKSVLVIIPGTDQNDDRNENFDIDRHVTPRDLMDKIGVDSDAFRVKVAGKKDFLGTDEPLFPHVEDGSKVKVLSDNSVARI